MFHLTSFFVREHVGLLKLKGTYDIIDPATQQQVGVAQETTPGWIIALRFLVNRSYLPIHVAISQAGKENAPGAKLIELKRGWTFLRSTVAVIDAGGTKIGYFRSKLFSIGGGFHVFDAQDQQIAEVKGDWKGWNFRFLDTSGAEIGTVTKKWSGMGKELFTSADNYMVALNPGSKLGAGKAALLLAAGISIDIVYKTAN